VVGGLFVLWVYVEGRLMLDRVGLGSVFGG